MLRTINKNQVLILTNIPRVPASVTSVLRGISRRHKIPLSTLKRNAQILKEFNLIAYGDPPNFSGVELTELGRFISSLTVGEEPTVHGNMVQTRSGFRPLGTVIKDLRKTVLRMIAEAGSGHLGASLSAVDILAILYMIKMKHDPKNPSWKDRDRFVLSKGHAAPALYAVLSEAGYISPDRLMTLREIGSQLQGHPDMETPGVDASTGSLGQGLSIGVGMALASKIDGSGSRTYVLLGDGELNEGQVWEAALTAPASILDALNACDLTTGKPSVIIAMTTKGKGISFMEGNKYSRKTPDAQELKRALKELT